MSNELEAGQLGRWLDSQGAPGRGELPELKKLTGGSQNVLYLIQRGDERMVLRMPGDRADKGRMNELLREIRLVRALKGTDVPHAELFAADETGELLGKPFYVMAEIDGWSPMDGGWQPPFDTDLEARRGLAFQLIEGAAKLGRVDWRAQGLEGFGKPEGFHDRQVDRWLAFLRSFQVRELPGLYVAAEWLRRNRPEHFTPGIMHGDYHAANVMFSPTGPDVVAVVDWEMSTIGDPLQDLGWMLATWYRPGHEPVLPNQLMSVGGLATPGELIERYGRNSGRDLSQIDWYAVLACFKLGIILEGSHARAGAGLAPKEIGDVLHTATVRLFDRALAIMEGER